MDKPDSRPGEDFVREVPRFGRGHPASKTSLSRANEFSDIEIGSIETLRVELDLSTEQKKKLESFLKDSVVFIIDRKTLKDFNKKIKLGE